MCRILLFCIVLLFVGVESGRHVERSGCPDLECANSCKNHEMRVISTNGCPVCACIDPTPCREIICSEGQTCRMVQVHCARWPCPPLAICIADPCYTRPVCEIGCLGSTAALAMDEDGCFQCSCQDYCQDVDCGDGKTCQLARRHYATMHGPVYTECV